MKAVVQDVYRSADTLRLEDIEMPVIGDDEVLVQVRAAGVDPGVWHLMTGRPYLVHLMGMGVRRPKVRVRGHDLSGVVEAVGSRVTRFRPGDEVYGVSTVGSFVEYARSRESELARKPAKLTFEQAAAVPVSGMTALRPSLRAPGRWLLNIPGALDNIPVGIPDFHRAIPLLLNPVDLWHSGGTKSRSELGDGVRIRKLTPEMDAIDHVRGQRVTLDERHHEAVIEAQTGTPVFDGHCSRQSDLVHVEPHRPFHVADAQGKVAKSHVSIMHEL